MTNIQEKIERVRAIIINDRKILLINRIKDSESYWVIPGGRVELKETHQKALARECREELGVRIRVNRLFEQKASSKPGMEGHQEFFYLCDIVDGRVGSGQGPEFKQRSQYKGEYKISWVSLEELANIDLRPYEIRDKIINDYLNT